MGRGFGSTVAASCSQEMKAGEPPRTNNLADGARFHAQAVAGFETLAEAV